MTSDNKKQPPAASGVRQQWTDMPQKIRDLIEDYLGSTVVTTETQSGGFSPGVAARLYTADERCFFLKAMGTDLNSSSVNFHRKEIKINKAFPTNSVAPKLLWSYDDAEDTEWVALLFDNVDGENPATPWQNNDLQRVMIALGELSDVLTPSPIQSLPSASDYFSQRINGWQRIQSGAALIKVDQLDDWSKRHLDALCEREKKAPDAVAGHTLVHFDIRADNIVMNDDVWFVDWPHACIGAKWLDVVAFAPSVAMQSDVLPDTFIQQHPACRDADPEEITAAVISIAGMLTHNGLLPAPAGLPTLRAFQAAQAEVARQWVAKRTGWQ
ncbi:MAG: phosphotransferase [Phototrophicaceae bacterium]